MSSAAPTSPIVPLPIIQPDVVPSAVQTTDDSPLTPKPATYDLSQFQLDEILGNATNRKMVTCLGRFVDRSPTDQAIVLFEKNPFDERHLKTTRKRAAAPAGDLVADGGDEVEQDGASGDGATVAVGVAEGYFSASSTLEERFTNDIYGTFECFPNPALNSVKTTVIYPATANHIKKYRTQEVFIYNESPEDYRTKTLPHLESEQFSLEWVYNILEHRKETEHIVLEDSCPQTGFVLLPDLKWDGKTLEALYLQAIVQRRDLKSIRDLTAAELPLLYNLRIKCKEAIANKYNIPATQLRVYFHYQPSFYHLHVHFTYLLHEAPGIRCERGHLLDTVINNLELVGDYYQRATLPFVVARGYKLYDLYATAEKDKSEDVAAATTETVQQN